MVKSYPWITYKWRNMDLKIFRWFWHFWRWFGSKVKALKWEDIMILSKMTFILTNYITERTALRFSKFLIWEGKGLIFWVNSSFPFPNRTVYLFANVLEKVLPWFYAIFSIVRQRAPRPTPKIILIDQKLHSLMPIVLNFPLDWYIFIEPLQWSIIPQVFLKIKILHFCPSIEKELQIKQEIWQRKLREAFWIKKFEQCDKSVMEIPPTKRQQNWGKI